jgi:hypothetical protein
MAVAKAGEVHCRIRAVNMVRVRIRSNAPVPPNDGQLHDAAGLEFPDWSGMLPHEGRLTFEQAMHWNKGMLTIFLPKPNRAALDADLKCDVEFRL